MRSAAITAISAASLTVSVVVLAGGSSSGRYTGTPMSSLGRMLASRCWFAESWPTVGFAFFGVPMTGSQPYPSKYTSGNDAPCLGRTSRTFSRTSPPSKP